MTKTAEKSSAKDKVQVKKVRSITMKGLGFSKDVSRAILNSDDDNLIVRVTGEAHGFSERENDFGMSYCFEGVFLAKNLHSGEIQSSNKAYFPGELTEKLAETLKSASGAVSFDYQISVVASDKYEHSFLCEPVAEPEEVDRQQKMLDNMLKQF